MTATSMSGTCIICGCTDDRPCLGGAVYTASAEIAFVQRLVPEENILAGGATCFWLDTEHTMCSAHSATDLARHGFAVARHGDGLSEFGLGVGSLGGYPW